MCLIPLPPPQKKPQYNLALKFDNNKIGGSLGNAVISNQADI